MFISCINSNIKLKCQYSIWSENVSEWFATFTNLFKYIHDYITLNNHKKRKNINLFMEINASEHPKRKPFFENCGISFQSSKLSKFLQRKEHDVSHKISAIFKIFRKSSSPFLHFFLCLTNILGYSKNSGKIFKYIIIWIYIQMKHLKLYLKQI
jgi:hypothetical protein